MIRGGPEGAEIQNRKVKIEINMKRLVFHKNVFALLAGMSYLVLGLQGRAQNLIHANPAEMYDFKSSFINPAIYSLQDAHVAIGGKLFHLGFVDDQSSPFRQGYVSVVLPYLLGNLSSLGLQAQYFNSPLFTESLISLGLAHRLGRKISLGFKMNIFSRAFNSKEFDLVDIDDPVFASGTTRWNASFGLGFIWAPLDNLTLGLGLDHLNQPDISLGPDVFQQPIKAHVGGLWDLGFLQVSLSTSYENGKFLPKITIGKFAYRRGYVRLGYGQRAAQFEGQIHLNGPLSLNYTYEWTFFDNEAAGSGSHQFTLIHEFEHQRKMPEMEIPDELVLQFEPPDKFMRRGGRFYVYPDDEKLQILEKKIKRIIDPKISQEALAQLSKADLELGQDGSFPYLDVEGVEVDSSDIPTYVQALYSKAYQKFLQNLATRLEYYRRTQINILTPEKALLRAAGIKKQLTEEDNQSKVKLLLQQVMDFQDSVKVLEQVGLRKIPLEETQIELHPEFTQFKIVPVVRRHHIQSWRLIIQNANGQSIKIFQGKGMPVEELSWDWRNDRGQILTPGNYHFYLEWQDFNGQVYRSDPGSFTVQKIIRNVTIEITKQPKIGEDVDEIKIMLKQ